VQPVVSEGEELLLICFVDEPKAGASPAARPPRGTFPASPNSNRSSKRRGRSCRGAIRNLEISSEEQKAINEEALSVNEEFQSTNEELLTSKEELQSLNEELTALNSQLQETLERQRTTSNDLQNVLYSTDVATLFLDTEAQYPLLHAGDQVAVQRHSRDIGRPLADLNSLAADGALLATPAGAADLAPIEREIEAQSGAWYIAGSCPTAPRTTGSRASSSPSPTSPSASTSADALEAAKRQAELANLAKSRFLAAASHDLRQPLQTLACCRAAGESRGRAPGKAGRTARRDLGAMSGMLNTLLDINQIEAGTVRAEIVDFPINDLLDRLKDEFTYHAQAKGLGLRVVPCSLSIDSDPRLLEQMIRNLLSNALKYTKRARSCSAAAGTEGC
jgi:two-component system CheB/CheR fusion protein